MQAARGASLSASDQRARTGTRHRRRLLTVFAVIAAAGYTLDVVTKVLAVDRLSGRGPVPVVGDLLVLILARNPGAAFSTGTSFTLALSCLAIGAVLAVLWTVRRVGSLGWAIGLGFLLAGVLGNLTDRVFRAPGPLRGHVVDFLALPHWPVFNVADMCINVAAAIIIVQALRGTRLDGGRTRDDAADGSETSGEATDGVAGR